MTTLALAAGIWAGGIVSAQAAARDGNCDTGEFCYYYDNGTTGSASDFTASLANYGTIQPSCYEFRGAGNGKGLCIKNRAASVWNRAGQTVRVYFNSNYAGAYQDIAPGVRTDLNATLRKENASHAFLATPAAPPAPPAVPTPPAPAPPAECSVRASYSVFRWLEPFEALAQCRGVPSATLTMTVATRKPGADWIVLTSPTVYRNAPWGAPEGQYFLTSPTGWYRFDSTPGIEAWALAHVCWKAAATTVCRDDYVTAP
ncbi:MAG: peptidase inhibitor family I36 protein [Kineosporiaceae bacterium]